MANNNDPYDDANDPYGKHSDPYDDANDPYKKQAAASTSPARTQIAEPPPQPGPAAQMWNKFEQAPVIGAVPGAAEEAWHHPLLALPRLAAGFAGGVGEGLELPATLGAAGAQTVQGLAGVPENQRFKIPSADAAMRQYAQPLIGGGNDTRPHHGGADLYNIGSIAGQMVGSAPYGGILTKGGGYVLGQLAKQFPHVADALRIISEEVVKHPQIANVAAEAGTGAGTDVALESAGREQEGKGIGATPAGLATGAGLGMVPPGARAAWKGAREAPKTVASMFHPEEAEFAPVQAGPKKFNLEAAEGQETPQRSQWAPQQKQQPLQAETAVPEFTDPVQAFDAWQESKDPATQAAAKAYLEKAQALKVAPQLQEEPAQAISESSPQDVTQPKYSATDIDLKGKSFFKNNMIPREDVEGIHGGTVDWNKPDELQTVDLTRPIANQNSTGPKMDSLGQPIWRRTKVSGYAKKIDGQDYFEIEKLHGEKHEASRIQASVDKSLAQNSDRWRGRKTTEELTPEDRESLLRQETHTPEAREFQQQTLKKHLDNLYNEVPDIGQVPDLGEKLADFLQKEEGSAPAGYPLEVAKNVVKGVVKGGKIALKTANNAFAFRKDSDIIKQHQSKFGIDGLDHKLYQQIAKEHLARLNHNVSFDSVQHEEARKLLGNPKFKEEDILNPANSPHLSNEQRNFVVDQKAIRQETVETIDNVLKHLEGKDKVPEELTDTLERWKDSQFGPTKGEKDTFGNFLENVTANIYQSQFSGNIGNELLQATDPLIFGTSRVGPVTMVKAYWTVLTDPKVRSYFERLGLKGDMSVRRQALLDKQSPGWKAFNKPLEVKVGKHTLSTTGSPSEALNSAVMFTAGVIQAGQKVAKKGLLSDITKKAGSQYLHNYIDWVEKGTLKGGMSYEDVLDATVHGIRATEDVLGGATLNMDKDPLQRSALLRLIAPFSRQQIRVSRLFSQYARAGDVKSLSILTGMIIAGGGSAIIPKELIGLGLDKKFPRQYLAAKEILDTLNAPRYAGLSLEKKIQMATYNISQTLPTQTAQQFGDHWNTMLEKGFDFKKPEDRIRAIGMVADLMLLTGATPFGIGAGQLKKTAKSVVNLQRGYADVQAYGDYGGHLATGREKYGPSEAAVQNVSPAGETVNAQNFQNKMKGLSLIKRTKPYKNMNPQEAQEKSTRDISNIIKTYPTNIPATKRYF